MEATLENSESSKSLNQNIKQAQNLVDRSSSQVNKLTSGILEEIEQQDPQKRYEKIIAGRVKQMKELRKENRDYIEKIKQLERQVERLKQENRSPKNVMVQNSKTLISNSRQLELLNSDNHDSVQPHSNALSLDLSTHINEQQRQNQQYEQNAREQAAKELQHLLRFRASLIDVFEKLQRMAKLEKITQGDVQNDEKLTVTISKEKYNFLLDFYCQEIPILQQKSQDSNDGSVKQFSAQEVPAPNRSINQNQTWSIEQLEKIFEGLAQKHSKTQEWNTYVSNRQNESQKQLMKLKEIVLGKNDKQNQASIEKAKETINLSQNNSMKNKSLEKTASIINCQEKQIEAALFSKIKSLLKELNFSQIEYNLFVRFDQKRKCDRLYDIDEFLNKFKNKTDLHEISEAYTVYLVKTINSLLLNVMGIIAGSDAQNPQDLKWFNDKLDKKSSQVRKKVFSAIEEQFNEYMDAKHPKREEGNGGKKKISQIKEAKFDKDKKLEKELARIIYEYRTLVKSSLFNYNKEIKLRL